MRKIFFVWLFVCLYFQKGFSQTIDYSGIYKASLTFWGFKFAEEILILKKLVNNTYTGSIQAHSVSNERSLIKANVDTTTYTINELIIGGGILSYKIDKLKSKRSFIGRFSNDYKSIKGKGTDKTNTIKITYIKEKTFN